MSALCILLLSRLQRGEEGQGQQEPPASARHNHYGNARCETGSSAHSTYTSDVNVALLSSIFKSAAAPASPTSLPHRLFRREEG
jgi:hypothetical protein